GQGCAATASCPRIGNYCWHTHSVRITPPLRADMIFGNDNARGECANSISTRLRSRRDCSKASVPASALPLHWAVPFYRSKFTDWLAGAVPNSYPNVDLLWDSLIAGPWGWPRSTVQARVPTRRLLPLLAGRERSICQPGEFSIEKCNP